MAERQIAYHSYKPGVDIPPEFARSTFRSLVDTAKDFFGGTHFVEGGTITASDLEPIGPFYQKALEISPFVFNERTLCHLMVTGKMSRAMGDLYNINGGFNLNLDELEAVGWLHDIGRTGSHRRAINDIWARLLMKRAGFTSDFLDLFPDEKKLMPVMVNGEIDFQTSKEQLFDLRDLVTFPQRGIVELADAISKVKNHRLMTWEEFRTVSLEDRQSPPDESSWKSEYRRQENTIYLLKDGSAAAYFFMLGGWFEALSKTRVQDVIDIVASQLKQEGVELPERS